MTIGVNYRRYVLRARCFCPLKPIDLDMNLELVKRLPCLKICLLALLALMTLMGCGDSPKHPSLIGQVLPESISLREMLAGGGNDSNYQLSPDGKTLAWLTVEHNKTKIAIRSVGEEKVAHIDASVSALVWANDRRSMLYLADTNGDENFHIWLVDTQTPHGRHRDLTPYQGARASIVVVSRKSPSIIFVEHNKRDAKVFDLYQLNISTGEEWMIEKNPGTVTRWLLDADDVVRGRITQQGQKRSLEIRASPTQTAWRSLKSWDLLDTFIPLDFSADKNWLWLVSNIDQDRIGLAKLNLDSGNVEWVYQDGLADLDIEQNIVRLGPRSKLPLLATSEPNYPKAKVFLPALDKALAQFASDGPIRLGMTSIDDAERQVTVQVFDGLGTKHYLINLENGKTELLGMDTFSRMRESMAQSKPIQFKSKDGLILNGYLTRPRGLPQGLPLPMVVRVHGGPWYRNIWGNTDFLQAAKQVQFLANRGYAVLEVNFRGSTGYGRKFMEAAIGEFGKAMQDDLIDGVNWAVAQGIADPKNVAILGTSYGGYAALVGMAKTPDIFACGIAGAAPTNLATLIESFPPYWNLDMALWDRYVGKPSKTEEKVQMLSVSPITLASSIRAPLLMIHGQNDARVRIEQAQELITMLKRHGKQAELLVLKDEGHFVSNWRANLKSYRAMETFLSKCLGGRNAGSDFHELAGVATWR